MSDLGTLTAAQAPTVFTNILHDMTQAIARIPNMSRGRPVFYMNRTVFTGLMRLGLEKSNNAVTVQNALDQFGTIQNMLSFLGVPIRRVDASGLRVKRRGAVLVVPFAPTTKVRGGRHYYCLPLKPR